LSPAAWDIIDLVLCLAFAAGFSYYYVAGVADRNRALSRASALAFLACVAGAVVFAVRNGRWAEPSRRREESSTGLTFSDRSGFLFGSILTKYSDISRGSENTPEERHNTYQ
jgi:hypothetical protein